MKKNFYITTFGCRTNQADSASIHRSLVESGFREVAQPGQADLILVNSCTVTHRSDQQVRQLTRRFHRENPQAQIVLTGCFAQRDPKAVVKISGVSAVVGNTNKNKLVELVRDLDSVPDSLLDSGEREGTVRAKIQPPVFRREFEKTRSFSSQPALPIGDKTRPLVKIQDGCDSKCSYCIVPTVRGPSRSLPPDEILGHIRLLISEGFREIVLTGIHIGTYGLHFRPRVPFDSLIRRISKLPGEWRLRLSSIEPMELSRRVIDLAADSERIAPHFHICLQSGSDAVLKRMLRPYNTRRFAKIVEEIERKIPNAGIGTDVIAGFPGETVSDHEKTLEFLEELPFTYFHVFPYSDRSGTQASTMKNKVSPAVIKERSRQLRELSAEKNRRFRERFIGQELSFLTLGLTGDSNREALSGNYLKALVSSEIQENRILSGIITRLRGEYFEVSV
jgi:threonylcarbamoyladenosine tRNA methylthiotransferase MtaB